jgi:hypothetical protein
MCCRLSEKVFEKATMTTRACGLADESWGRQTNCGAPLANLEHDAHLTHCSVVDRQSDTQPRIATRELKSDATASSTGPCELVNELSRPVANCTASPGACNISKTDTICRA